MAGLNPVQRWLQSILPPYRLGQQVYADVDRTLLAFPSLQPRTDTYTYDDGRTVLLLTLQGTLPIVFRGAQYNIPVAFWIPHNYPREPPFAYVTPNASMLVKPSRNVDVSGLCKGDYLDMWSRKPEGCNLLQLIESLQDVFSREPPLYAKPANDTSRQHQQQQHNYHERSTSNGSVASHADRAGKGRPPPQPPSAASLQQQQQQQQSNRSGPVLPAKPQISNNHYPMRRDSDGSGPPVSPIQRPDSTSSGQPFAIAASPASPNRPPVPNALRASTTSPASVNGYAAQPQTYDGPHPSYDHYQARAAYHQAVHQTASQHPQPLHPSTHGPAFHAQQQQQQYHSAPPSAAPAQPMPYHHHHHQPYEGSRAQDAPQPAPYIPPRPETLRNQTPTNLSPAAAVHPSSASSSSKPQSNPINLLDEEDYTAASSGSAAAPASGSAVPSSSSQAPPPPRPTNPELLAVRRALYTQLTYHLGALQNHLAGENTHLNVLRQDLEKGEPAIVDEMARLEAVRDVCASVRDRMQGVVKEAEDLTRDLTSRKEVGVDEIVCGTNVVHNQLLDLVAEDNALEDTVYHLGRAFNSDARTQDDLERFLKRTRTLCREQFMKRALINKILLDLALARAQRQ